MPWYTLTLVMLVIQLVLTILASFARSDFFTLTCVSIAILFVTDTGNLKYSTFRQLVALVFFSLVYDLIWFGLFDEKVESAQDGGLQSGLRQVILLLSYFSFFFRVSLSVAC